MASLRDKVAAVVSRNSGTDVADLTDATDFADDLEMDSLTVAETMIELEELPGRELPDDDVEHVRTFGEAMKVIERVVG